MKDLRELRNPTLDELKAALKAAKQGEDAVLEFLRKGRARKKEGGDGSGGEEPEQVIVLGKHGAVGIFSGKEKQS